MPKKTGFVTAKVSIRKSQLEWIKKNHYNLSAVVREYLDEFIRTMEKTKEGIAVPAWVKALDKDALRERMRQNPKLKSIIAEDD